jgi:mono/diheme cytochrome c family protein
VALTLVFISFLPATSKSKKQVDGKAYFQQRCASCHAGGGNLVEPARPVKNSKVLSNMESFKSYLSKPPGHMPYYDDVVKDPVMMRKLYDYCKSLKSIPIKQASRSGSDFQG